MMYNYLLEMTKDVVIYITDEIELENFSDREELESYLNDELLTEDSVTGNASGSYTGSSYQAEEYVTGNMDLLNDAVTELCIDSDTVGEKFLDEDWEYFDVTIRCYLLGQAISNALDELENEGKLVFDDDEDAEQGRSDNI